MTNEAQIASSADVADGGLLDGRGGEHSAHFQIVGDDKSAIADLLAQYLGDPFLMRATLAFSVLGDGRECGVRNHHYRQFWAQDR